MLCVRNGVSGAQSLFGLLKNTLCQSSGEFIQLVIAIVLIKHQFQREECRYSNKQNRGNHEILSFFSEINV